MRKKKIALLFIICLCLSLSGCSRDDEMTLHLSYGDRTGTYSGEVNDEGIPHGIGKFSSQNPEGVKWVYEGNFVNGHFEGEGKTTWEDGEIEIGTYKDDTIIPMTGKEIKKLYSSTESFKNHYVELVGKVFTAPEYFDGGVCVQMFSDIENSENNTIVYIWDEDFEVKQDDYLRVVGKVGDIFTGTNAFGGEITAPTIDASECEIIDYKSAVAPTSKEIQVNQTKKQHGYAITVQKVELASSETRVYVKVDNKGSDSFTVYTFDAKIAQDGKQYSEQDNWNADYPEIQTDLLVGNSTEGIITFPSIDEAPFKIYLEGHSENWNEDFKPFIFEVSF